MDSPQDGPVTQTAYSFTDTPTSTLPPPSSLQVVSVVIPNWSVKRDAKGDYVVYHIEIATDTTKWQVEKRFSEIEVLAEWALANFPNVVLPAMPGKFGSWFKSIESSAKDRLSGLESFIQAIFNTPSLFTSFEVQNFLGIDSHMEALHPVAADLIEGTLYIKLIEARNLPIIEAGSAPSSYAEQYIVAPLKNKQRAGVIKSATYSGSTHPKWFEESVFSIRDRRLPMRLQVWDSKFIVSDKLLSHIQMDLRSLQPHQLYDIWLPLIGGDNAEIHVLAQFTPMKIQKSINMKLPDFRVRMEKSEYYPGEIVRGLLVLNVGTPLSANQVYVKLFGYTETHWTEQHTEHYTDNQGRSQTRMVTKHYGQTMGLIDERRLCWIQAMNPDKRAEIASGSYVWPFEFALPPRLPPTFNSAHGWIKYGIRATVDRPGLSFNKRISAPIRLLAPYTSANPLPRVYGRLQKLPFRAANQVVYIQGNLNSDISIIGTPQTLNLSIENLSNKNVLDAEISVRGTMVAKAHGRAHVTTLQPFFTRVREGFPIRAGETKQLQVHFQFPSDIAPSLPPDLSPLIDLNYVMHVSCDISGFLTGRARADIPMIVSHPLPPPPQMMVHPPLYPSVQPDQASMINYGVGLPQFAPSYYSPFPDQRIAIASAPHPDEPKYSNDRPMFAAPPPPQSAYYVGGNAPANYPMGGPGSMPQVSVQFPTFVDGAPDQGVVGYQAPMGGDMQVSLGAPGMQMNMNAGGYPGGDTASVQVNMNAGYPSGNAHVNMNMNSGVGYQVDTYGAMPPGGAQVSMNVGEQGGVGFQAPPSPAPPSHYDEAHTSVVGASPYSHHRAEIVVDEHSFGMANTSPSAPNVELHVETSVTTSSSSSSGFGFSGSNQ